MDAGQNDCVLKHRGFLDFFKGDTILDFLNGRTIDMFHFGN